MFKTITIISSLLIATAGFAGKDGKDYFVLKSTESSSEKEICSIEYEVTETKDGRTYFVLKNGLVFSAEDYPCK